MQEKNSQKIHNNELQCMGSNQEKAYFCKALNCQRELGVGPNICGKGCIFYRDAGEVSERMRKAFSFAANAHKNQRRKGSGLPYMIHLVSALEIAVELTQDEEVRIATLLHDTIEDTAVTREDLEEQFGERVAELVVHDSEDKHRERPAQETWKQRKIENISNIERGNHDVKVIALSDKLSNLRSLAEDVAKCGDATWERFNQKDKLEHKWYYSQFVQVFEEFKDTFAYIEYCELLKQVWKE